MKEKVAAGISILTLFLSLTVGYATMKSNLARMEERINNISSTNVQTLQVLNRLAESVDKLSRSVARLDERTKVLERTD
jgi:ubiquinone biosynthesis protein UbiJ